MKISLSTARSFLQGNESSSEEVYNAYRKVMFFVLSSYLKNIEDIKDAYQEAFARLLEKRSEITAPENLQSYFNLIVRSVGLDMAKKSKTETMEDGFEPSSNDPVFLDDLLPYDLSKEEKMILGGRIVIGYSWDEISAWLNVPISTCKLRYKQALEKVRKELRR